MDILFKIFREIYYFIVIFFIAVIFFSHTFYLISKNQVDFDEKFSIVKQLGEPLPPGYLDRDKLPFKMMSILYVTKLSFGDDEYMNGEDQKYLPYLLLFYYLSTLVLSIGLLNMLIAIMSSVYNERQEVANQVRIRDHLIFVVDNWYLRDIAFKDYEQIKYIICAFLQKREFSEQKLIHHIHDEIMNLKSNIHSEFEDTRIM